MPLCRSSAPGSQNTCLLCAVLSELRSDSERGKAGSTVIVTDVSLNEEDEVQNSRLAF